MCVAVSLWVFSEMSECAQKVAKIASRFYNNVSIHADYENVWSLVY